MNDNGQRIGLSSSVGITAMLKDHGYDSRKISAGICLSSLMEIVEKRVAIAKEKNVSLDDAYIAFAVGEEIRHPQDELIMVTGDSLSIVLLPPMLLDPEAEKYFNQ